mmetsp:Transcript_40203/g.96290  ORF Transcript_40203/g.96290 Transcript_40203/m.96290 type:complete len:346 (-) Transcript_40203:122-1159(-)
MRSGGRRGGDHSRGGNRRGAQSTEGGDPPRLRRLCLALCLALVETCLELLAVRLGRTVRRLALRTRSIQRRLRLPPRHLHGRRRRSGHRCRHVRPVGPLPLRLELVVQIPALGVRRHTRLLGLLMGRLRTLPLPQLLRLVDGHLLRVLGHALRLLGVAHAARRLHPLEARVRARLLLAASVLAVAAAAGVGGAVVARHGLRVGRGDGGVVRLDGLQRLLHRRLRGRRHLPGRVARAIGRCHRRQQLVEVAGAALVAAGVEVGVRLLVLLVLLLVLLVLRLRVVLRLLRLLVLRVVLRLLLVLRLRAVHHVLLVLLVLLLLRIPFLVRLVRRRILIAAGLLTQPYP